MAAPKIPEKKQDQTDSEYVLSAEEQLRFALLLLDPPELIPAMLRAKKVHAELFGQR